MQASTLQDWAQARGYRVACGSVQAVVQAQADVRKRHDKAELDEQLYRSGIHRCVEEAAAPSDGTLVIVAVPRPAHRLSFEPVCGPLDTLIPPTYVDFRQTATRVRDDLTAHVFVDHQVASLLAPLKAVAARLGLVRYGRNNITYSDGIGSYMQLCGYLTDPALTAPIADEHEPQVLEQCTDCDRCISTCPTGAIGSHRMLVCAHRCLTYANEFPGEWPAWVPRHSHHCLVGCLACQRSCPANPPLPINDVEFGFSPEETQALLTSPDDAPEPVRHGIRRKLQQLGLSSLASELGRNLQALIDKRAGKPQGNK